VHAYGARPSTLRSRLRALPAPEIPGLWANQQRAIASLERSLADDKPRALVQMATGSGKSLTSVAAIYRLDLDDVATISATPEEISRLRLTTGDVLFNEVGDRDKLGRGWIWEGQLPECIHQNHVFRARPVSAEVSSKFLSWSGNSAGQRYFFDEGKQTTNLASLNSTKLRRLPIPLPPAAEQLAIATEVDRLLTDADAALGATAAGQKRIARLRQSILKWAFEGKLVDQDPNDEPASALLARIKAERAADPPGGPATPRARRAKTTRPPR
jgi:type I restriction enzyme S subunit